MRARASVADRCIRAKASHAGKGPPPNAVFWLILWLLWSAGHCSERTHTACTALLAGVIFEKYTSRPTPANRENDFHSESGNCTIVFQLCFTTRNLRTKLCGIRSQTEEQEFVDPFKSWYLETLSISEMENRRASPYPRLGEGLN